MARPDKFRKIGIYLGTNILDSYKIRGLIYLSTIQ